MGNKPSWEGSSEEFNQKQKDKAYVRLKESFVKAIKLLYRQEYLSYRRGAFDFPSEDEFVEKETDLFFKNYAEELNIIYENGKIL